ncbi:MAG TPA: hypothetical protein VGD76_15160 [Ramlibacter sp.]
MLPDTAPSPAAPPRRSRLALPLVIAATAATTVVAAAAVLVFVLWPEGVTIVVAPAGVPVVAPGARPRATDDCDSCGAVESIRHTDPATGLPIYEFTVRMRDGSVRESSESKPGRWRAGERVLLIGGPKARAAEERANLAP